MGQMGLGDRKKLAPKAQCSAKFGHKIPYIYIYIINKWGGVRKWEMGVPQNGWYLMENLRKMNDLGGTPILGNLHIYIYK